MTPETKRFIDSIEYLKRKGLVKSQRDFCRKLQIAPSTVTEIKHGRNNNINNRFISKAIKKFGLNSNWIFTGTGPVLASDLTDENAKEIKSLVEKITALERENSLLRQIVDLSKNKKNLNGSSTILHRSKKHKRNQ